MTTQAYTGTSRNDYLAWVANWKSAYKTLSNEIRELKSQRKMNRYEYRDPKDTAVQRRTVIGDNPNYNSSATYKLMILKEQARHMMWLREESKEIARQQYAARMMEAA